MITSGFETTKEFASLAIVMWRFAAVAIQATSLPPQERADCSDDQSSRDGGGRLPPDHTLLLPRCPEPQSSGLGFDWWDFILLLYLFRLRSIFGLSTAGS